MPTFFGVDLARMYSATTGDSDIVLTTAVPGCKTFAAAGVGDSDTVNYGIISYNVTTHRPVASEVGVGKYIAATTTLKRTTVLHSTDSDDSAIDLTALSEVYIPFLQKDVLRVRDADSDPSAYPVNTLVFPDGSLTDNGSGQVTVIGTPFAQYTDAGTVTVANGNTAVIPMDSSVYDAWSIGTLSDSDDKVTLNEAGWYSIFASVGHFSNGTDYNGKIYIGFNPSGTFNTGETRGYTTAMAINTEDVVISLPLFHATLDNTSYVQISVTNNSGQSIDAYINYLNIIRWKKD